jgi:hypothetical protein
MTEVNEFLSRIEKKCFSCFRRDAVVDGCLLFKEKHAGIELCLGPFKDQEDRLQKVREDSERERKAKPDWDRIVRDARLNRYFRNKKPFDEWGD